jgi:hypothetical protein
MLDVTTILHQAHLGASLRVVSSASQYHAVSLPEVSHSVLSQRISCVCFFMGCLFLKVAQKLNRGGIGWAVVTTDAWKSLGRGSRFRLLPWSLMMCGMLHHLAGSNHE